MAKAMGPNGGKETTNPVIIPAKRFRIIMIFLSEENSLTLLSP